MAAQNWKSFAILLAGAIAMVLIVAFIVLWGSFASHVLRTIKQGRTAPSSGTVQGHREAALARPGLWLHSQSSDAETPAVPRFRPKCEWQAIVF
jgi:hypothetical protein